MRNELDVHQECGTIYLLSPEIVFYNWRDEEEQIVNLPANLLYNDSFKEDPAQRIKFKMKYSSTVQDLWTKI